MKSVAIFYFTGTGNTREVLAMVVSAFGQEGVQTQSFDIAECLRNGMIPDITGADAIGIGYPIHAFNAPGMVEAFLKKLPPTGGIPAFVFKTAGEPLPTNSASSIGISRILRRKGSRIVYERLFLMPYNILFRYPDEAVKEIMILNRALARKLARDVAQGAGNRPFYNPLGLLAAFVMQAFRPLARLNGRMYQTTPACTLCQKCVRECPTGNIGVREGRIAFGGQCAMCMRCVMYCPQGAIRAGWIDRLSVRGGYDFARILNDPAIQSGYIKNCKKGFFVLLKKYVQKMEKAAADFL